MRELGDLTGRPLAPVERYETADAEEIVVAVGQAYPAARAAAEGLRREGAQGGGRRGARAPPVLPGGAGQGRLARARSIAVIEPLDIALAPSGPLATSLKAAFADAITWAPGFPGVGRIPPIVSVVFATLDRLRHRGAGPRGPGRAGRRRPGPAAHGLRQRLPRVASARCTGGRGLAAAVPGAETTAGSGDRAKGRAPPSVAQGPEHGYGRSPPWRVAPLSMYSSQPAPPAAPALRAAPTTTPAPRPRRARRPRRRAEPGASSAAPCRS